MNGLLVIFTVESGVHAGGSDSIGTIDEPIQRDVTTGFPIIHGQSVKGAARRRYRRYISGLDSASTATIPSEDDVFGGEPPGPADAGTAPKQGSVSIGDAVMALFPVPTMQRCFAWVTSPHALEQVHRRAALCEVEAPDPIHGVDPNQTLVADAGWAQPGGEVDLGDFKLSSRHDPRVTTWATWFAERLPSGESFTATTTKLRTDLIVVSDDLMRELTHEHTEIAARVQLEPDQKTVKHGPFYSEYLPANTVLVSRFGSNQQILHTVRACFDEAVWQIGGHESIGKGLVWTRAIGAGR